MGILGDVPGVRVLGRDQGFPVDPREIGMAGCLCRATTGPCGKDRRSQGNRRTQAANERSALHDLAAGSNEGISPEVTASFWSGDKAPSSEKHAAREGHYREPASARWAVADSDGALDIASKYARICSCSNRCPSSGETERPSNNFIPDQ